MENDKKEAFKYLLAKEIPKIFDAVLKDPVFAGIKERAGQLSVEIVCYIELWEFARQNISRISRELEADPARRQMIIDELARHPAAKADEN